MFYSSLGGGGKENIWSHAFPNGISVKWNSIGPGFKVQSLIPWFDDDRGAKQFHILSTVCWSIVFLYIVYIKTSVQKKYERLLKHFFSLISPIKKKHDKSKLVVWVFWQFNLCRLFNAKSIFMLIVLFQTIQFSTITQFNCPKISISSHSVHSNSSNAANSV